MTTFLEGVLANAAEQDAKRSAARRAKSANVERQWTDRLTPLESRLAKLIAEIPMPVQERGLSLEPLRRMLAGKFRGNCHPGELGDAMRKLGWKRRRNWATQDNGFRSTWFKEKQ